jgi:tetratricopeptide (TPR) repeat protein
MTKLIYISILLLLVPFGINSQTREKIELNDGIANYERGQYKDAQTKFEKAYAENPNYARALYNAGNSAYLAGNFDTAMIYYNDYADKIQSKKEIAKAQFNVGNANLQKAAMAEANPETAKNAQAFYKEAINAYKQSLKNEPNDIETKYNLTYALDKLKKNQEQQQQEGEGDSDQNKENQDKGDKDDKGDNQNKENGEPGDKGDEGNKEGDKSDQKDGEQEGDQKGDKENDPNGDPKDEEKEGDEKEEQSQNGKEGDQNDEQPVEGQISKAQAIKDLDAINADEGKILQKVYQKKGDKKANNKSSKDW